MCVSYGFRFGRTPTRAQTQICQAIFERLKSQGYTLEQAMDQLYRCDTHTHAHTHTHTHRYRCYEHAHTQAYTHTGGHMQRQTHTRARGTHT